MANMRMLIRIVFVIFIANGIDCLGRVCDDCCDCFKEEEKKEEIKEYEEIKDEGNNIAKSLVNWFWFDDKEKNKENDLVLKIFKKEDDDFFPSKDNGDKISIKFDEKDNNFKIKNQNEAKEPLNLKDKKYVLFEIKIKGKKVYLYCNDVESSRNAGGIFQDTNYVSISVIACDTTNVKKMNDMFHNCENLAKLEFGENFNTTKVENMASMFSGCSSLTKLEFVKNFDDSHLVETGFMFNKCSLPQETQDEILGKK